MRRQSSSVKAGYGISFPRSGRCALEEIRADNPTCVVDNEERQIDRDWIGRVVCKKSRGSHNMTWNNGEQILKTRDDLDRVRLSPKEGHSQSQKVFRYADGIESTWAKVNEDIQLKTLRTRIEPWLTSLFQSEHLSLLIGAGLPFAVHRIATGESPPWPSDLPFGSFDSVISSEAKRSADAAKRRSENLEDRLRSANELLRGMEIMALTDNRGQESWREKVTEMEKLLGQNYREFANSILLGERNFVSSTPNCRKAGFRNLVGFLMSFASRSVTRERLHIFTTNYDRYIEVGADFAGLRLIDRFVGSLAPVFRASRLEVDLHYNPPGIRGEPRYLEGVARFTKLHGSVDWVDRDRQIQRIGLPFGARDTQPYLDAPGFVDIDTLDLMIYPNAAKDRETAAYPYVELFRDFAAAICRPNSTLVSYGYSFGDDHINRVIEDMLTIPSAHLVIISYDDCSGRINEMYERLCRHSQITLLIGDHLADLKTLVKQYLPKPAIDLTNIRMAELLQTRRNIRDGENSADENDRPTGGGA